MGDQVALHLDMPVERVYAHPAVRQNGGKVASSAPIVYCLEEADNTNLADLRLPPAAELTVVTYRRTGRCAHHHHSLCPAPRLDAPAGKLYATDRPAYTACQMTAIPYFLWAPQPPAK